ncbi:glycosyltransferase [Pseudomonas japonica]|uniref:glycosyltransferase n=1 Tax=Pseudomonas japonica TaxID=256466 RepID=UPI0015E29F65|nr:glycosyltransferase [Pseudomonas japonica]MBA1241971.1 glycosyltransferase [Pseudomonas japonica]
MNISIVLCTYNGSRYLKAQLESIVSQECLVMVQIIIFDDCSTDGTQEIIEGYSSVFRAKGWKVSLRYRVLNVGYIQNFTDAILLAEGDVVLFSDQDDVWMPSRIHDVLVLFNTDVELVLVHSDAALIDANDHCLGRTIFDQLKVSPFERYLLHSGQHVTAFLNRNLVTGATMAVRRDVLAAALPVPSGWIHDEWIALYCSLFGKCLTLSQGFIRYRTHSSNTVGLGDPAPTIRRSIIRENKLKYIDSRLQKLDFALARKDISGEACRTLLSHREFLGLRGDTIRLRLPRRLLRLVISAPRYFRHPGGFKKLVSDAVF